MTATRAARREACGRTACGEVGFHVMDVEEFELAIAHLRVPELV